MENSTKPKLIFFQFKHDQNLLELVLLHRQQHIKCLSEFFNVTVINEDCDYEEMCDRYQPDLTLFESGVNYRSIHRLDIKNTHSHPQVPKLGLHNGDSWCEARGGFLSDMENWGIDTFFSISTTMAEYTPEIADNLFVWPNFIDANIYRDYNIEKVIPILFTGFINQLYPWRQKIRNILSEYYPSLSCPHFGYGERKKRPVNAWQMISGVQYARTINASWFVPACGTIAKELVRKHLEIPACKSCLIAERTPAIEAAGFVDMKNCILVDENDILDKVNYLFQNIEELEEITNNGYQLVHSNHTLKQRDQILQWFNLYKKMKPNQKIIQTNPFEKFTIVEKTSESGNSHIICDGIVIQLLRQGDEKLWSSKYEEAEKLYLQCLNYISWMPEVKLGLALCNLYKGNAETAFYWIDQPIKYTLEVYKALSPDPVEWAYLIISILCQGKLDEARKRAKQFSSLFHSELENVRRVIAFLSNEEYQENLSIIKQNNHRYSIHRLPERSFYEWIENLCVMLQVCQQESFALELRNLISSEPKPLKIQRNYFGKTIEGLAIKIRSIRMERLKKRPNIAEIKHILKEVYSTPRNKIGLKLKKMGVKLLHNLENRYGYFLPYHFSAMSKDQFFQVIYNLARKENIKTALIIGASAGEGSTEVLLKGIGENRNTPTVFCINISTPKFIKLQKHYTNEPRVKCHKISSISRGNENDEIKSCIKKIQEDYEIDVFDVILIDGSEVIFNVELDLLHRTRFILLEDINILHNYKNHQMLINDRHYVLVAQNPALRNGYAIFKKSQAD